MREFFFQCLKNLKFGQNNGNKRGWINATEFIKIDHLLLGSPICCCMPE